MNSAMKLLAAAVLSVLLLTGCSLGQLFPEETTEPPKVERIALVVDDVSILEVEQNYPDLLEADFTGSECYSAIEAFAARNPRIAVRYLVRLGDTAAAPDAELLVLTPSDFDYDILIENLRYLPELRQITLKQTELSMDQIEALRSRYPELQIDFGIVFCGISCEPETVYLNLSELDPEEVLRNASILTNFPNLAEIELMTSDNSTSFTLAQAAELQTYVPGAKLHFAFDLFGKYVTTSDQEIVYVGQNIGKKEGALDTLRSALSILKDCKRFVLDSCQFSNETMAALRDEFRDTTKLVWRIYFGKGSCLTDLKVIRHVYDLYDYNSGNLIYCEDAEFLDFGHNELLKQCDFVAGMPNLRAVILSGSMVSDLSPFAGCEKLEFLELAYCGYVTDISPLASCTSLQRLNIAFTKVTDLSALDELNMQVLVDCGDKTTVDERIRFDTLHPECIVLHTGDQPYLYPWRYEQNGEPNEYYQLLKDMFGYPTPKNTYY